jgi:hypothetical protein
MAHKRFFQSHEANNRMSLVVIGLDSRDCIKRVDR